eukprot:sb/3462702/
MESLSFVENFWGSDFNSSAGFEEISRRMKTGKQSLTDLVDFIKKRAQIEIKYGQELSKLSHSALGKGESGTMHSCMDVFIRETDETGQIALSCAKALNDDVATYLSVFKDEQREARRESEDCMRRTIRAKKTSYEQMQRWMMWGYCTYIGCVPTQAQQTNTNIQHPAIHCKTAYERACTEAEKSSEMLKQNMGQPQKRLDQLKQKMKQSRQAAEVAVVNMESLSFVENFWGSDFNSSAGFEEISRRMKTGKQSLTDLVDFIKKRAQIEIKYGQELSKLSHSALGKGESGTMHSCMDVFIRETDETGQIALSCAKALNDDVATYLSVFKDEQREARRESEDCMRRTIRAKKTSYEQMQRCKTAYERACTEAEKSSEMLKQNMGQPQKRLDQLKQKMKQSRQAAEVADKEYMESVKTLERYRQCWEKDHEIYCKRMQDLELDRLTKMRNSIWTYTNICSQALVNTDCRMEEVRRILEMCDSSHDLNVYVKDRRTGSHRPEPIEYINFYQTNVKFDDEAKRIPKGHASNFVRVVALYEYAAQGPEEVSLAQGDLLVVLEKVDELWWYGKHKNGTVGLFPVTRQVHVFSVGGTEPIEYINFYQTNVKFDDEAKRIPKGHASNFVRVVALYEYAAQGPEEVSLAQGDLLVVLEKVDELWWYGKHKNGTVGLFPVTYVRELPLS